MTHMPTQARDKGQIGRGLTAKHREGHNGDQVLDVDVHRWFRKLQGSCGSL